MGYKGVHSFLVRPRRPLAITKRLYQEREEAIMQKETAEKDNYYFVRQLTDEKIKNEKQALKIEELKQKQKELEATIEELEERVDIEVEMNLKALDKSKEYHDRNL